MASCALWCQQRINGKVVSMLTEKAFWTHCTFGKHRKGTRLLAFLLTISLSPTLLSRRTFRRSCVVFKGLSTNQSNHLQAALNAGKCLNCLGFYQGLLRQGAKGIEASWALLLISGQLENLLLYVLDQTMAPSACTCIGTRRETALGGRGKKQNRRP